MALNIRCKAVLFDMDGTLVDSTVVVEKGWTMWAEQHGLSVEEVLSFSHGRPASATMEHFFPGRDHALDVQARNLYEETELEGVLAVPGALELVNSLQGHRWAIVTSAWRALAEIRVRTAGLPLPQVLVPVDEIQKSKPDPEGFLTAARLLGVDPANCLVFEDTQPGIDAGRSAGMQVVALTTTFAPAHLRHDVLIRDFNDVRITPGGEFLDVTIDRSVGQ